MTANATSDSNPRPHIAGLARETQASRAAASETLDDVSSVLKAGTASPLTAGFHYIAAGRALLKLARRYPRAAILVAGAAIALAILRSRRARAHHGAHY